MDTANGRPCFTTYTREHVGNLSSGLHDKLRWCDISSIVAVFGVLKKDESASVSGNHARGNNHKVYISDRCEFAVRVIKSPCDWCYCFPLHS